MKEGRNGRIRYALVLGILFSIAFVSLGSGSEFSVNPNTTNYTANREFNFTINNTDSALNISEIWVFLNSSFVYVDATNGTSASGGNFSNESGFIVWHSSAGLVENGTTQWFWINLTIPQPAIEYSFSANLTYDNGTNETKTFNITVNCSHELIPDLYLPTGGGYLYGGPVPFYGRALDSCGNTVTGVDIIYSINNTYNRTNTNPTHNTTGYGTWSEASGWYNFTWEGSDADRTVGMYNLTFYISKSGYPNNYTFSEDAFHLGNQPTISVTDIEKTSTCPETHYFNATVTDSDNNYNNITLEIRRWNGAGWDGWQVAN